MKYLDKLEKFDAETKRCMGEIGNFQKIHIFVDCLIESKIHRVPMEEYFKYQFYMKNRRGRESFCTLKKKEMFYNFFNEKKDRIWFDDKALFAKRFGTFMGRDEVDFENLSDEEFVVFMQSHPKIFLKPTDGSYGIGAQILETSQCTDVSALCRRFCGKHMVAEEFIEQSSELAQFNDSCVNSVRVMTLLQSNGDVEIVPYAALRLGRKGKMVDNFHNDGIAAMIDSVSGNVMTVGLDKSGNRWTVHPDSGKPIVGFHVPHWERVCECVKKAALVCPSVRFVGWDVTVTNDGRAVLIEGNSHPDPDVIQAVDGIGKWQLFDNYMHNN